MKSRPDRLFAVMTAIMILGSYILGVYLNRNETLLDVRQMVADSHEIIPMENDLFLIQDAQNSRLGYITAGYGTGFGGRLELSLRIDTAGNIEKVLITNHNETHSYFQKVMGKAYLNQYTGVHVSSIQSIEDIDAISNATASSNAINGAVLNSIAVLNDVGLFKTTVTNPTIKLKFRIPEILLMVLLILGCLGSLTRIKYKKQLRSILLVSGLIVIGFIYNKPLTISKVNLLLMDGISGWYNQLYWIILIMVVFLMIAIKKRNPYCHWFCPFGAVQEGLSKLGKAKSIRNEKATLLLTWFHRLLTFLVICSALIFRNPTKFNYEVYSGIFDLTGSVFTFILLLIVLFASLVIIKPWCKYLCPVKAVDDYIRTIRNWIVS